MITAERTAEHSIDLEGKLGFEARISGGHAFGQLTDALSTRLNQEPTFTDVLQKFIKYTYSEEPKLLSEELLGKWVGLAAEYTLLDAKKMPDEADGARWIALDGEVARLEDAILTAHRGEKSVTVDERFIRVIADSSGDTQKRIADSLDEVTQALSATATRAARKTLLVAAAGTMIFSACNPRSTITPEATPPTITQPAQTTEVPVIPRPIEIPTPKATDTGASSPTPRSSESTQVSGQNNSEKTYHFAELWSMYLDVQLQPGTPKGRVVDFFDYCTPHPNGCGFNSNDPDFDKNFHGHISGYRVNWVDGEWVYTEIK